MTSSQCCRGSLGPRPSSPGNHCLAEENLPKHRRQEADNRCKPLMRLPKTPDPGAAPQDTVPREAKFLGAPPRDPGEPPPRPMQPRYMGDPSWVPGAGSWGSFGPEGSRQPRAGELASGPLTRERFSSAEPRRVVDTALWPGIPGSTGGSTEPLPRPLRQRRLPGPNRLEDTNPLARTTGHSFLERAVAPPPWARAVPGWLGPRDLASRGELARLPWRRQG